MIEAVPGATPDATPAPDMAAIEGSLLPHVPPLNVLVSVIVLLWQIAPAPAIADGIALTVATTVATQPSTVV